MRGGAGAAGASCASKKAASFRAVGLPKISVLGSAGAPSPSACCSWLRSSTAPSESSPASSSGASASTSPPTVRAASASTVLSDTDAEGAAVDTVSCEGAFAGGPRRARLVPSWDKPSPPAPSPKKRRNAATIAPSSSGTTCPPLCHSIVMFSQRDGTLKSCAALSSSSALPSRCNEGTMINWEVDEELERRRARRHCGRDERAIGDATDTADRSVLLDPAFHVSHALTNCSGAACLVHCCRLPAKVAGAVVLSRRSEACEQLGRWAHGMRRVEELYLKAVRSELGQPAGDLQYPAH
eukprot:scaffold31954_cov66-Phaeocystis_antarctica.AAC.6